LVAPDRASPFLTWRERVWLVGERARVLARRIRDRLVWPGFDPLVTADDGGHARHVGPALVDVPVSPAGGDVRAPLRARPAGRARAGRGHALDRTTIRVVENHPSQRTDARRRSR
jgi:hypothetical protein